VSLVKRLLLWVMAGFYVSAGINHFRDPGFYLPMMPPFLPWHEELVFGSGVAEIALGIAVLVPRWRRPAAWGLIALLIAVFPANLYIAFENIPLGGRSEGLAVLNWVRLPFQAVFIVWAWWYTRPDPVPRARAG
jgi:uncharacterized membrane protein